MTAASRRPPDRRASQSRSSSPKQTPFAGSSSEQLGPLGAQLETIVSPEQAVPVFRQEQELVERALQELKALEIPSGDEADVNAYITNIQAGLPIIEQMAQALKRGDLSTVKALGKTLGAQGAQGRKAAQAYGFKVCGADDGEKESTGGSNLPPQNPTPGVAGTTRRGGAPTTARLPGDSR